MHHIVQKAIAWIDNPIQYPALHLTPLHSHLLTKVMLFKGNWFKIWGKKKKFAVASFRTSINRIYKSSRPKHYKIIRSVKNCSHMFWNIQKSKNNLENLFKIMTLNIFHIISFIKSISFKVFISAMHQFIQHAPCIISIFIAARNWHVSSLPLCSEVFGQTCLGKQCRPRSDCSAIPSASFGCNTLRKSRIVQLLGWLQHIFRCPKF